MEKHHAHRYYLKASPSNSQIRIRTLSNNNSLKHLHSTKTINSIVEKPQPRKHSLETSFFAVESKFEDNKQIDNLGLVHSQKKRLRKNSSLRLIRNFRKQGQDVSKIVNKPQPELRSDPKNSRQAPSSCADMASIENDQSSPQKSGRSSSKSSLKKNSSLKKRVEEIRKIHERDLGKTRFMDFISNSKQIKSENLLGEGPNKNLHKKSSKTKLKIMVRDPFGFAGQEKKRKELFTESKIEPIEESLISEQNKEEFEEFLSCIS